MSAPIDHKAFTIAKLNDGSFTIIENTSQGEDFQNGEYNSPARGVVLAVVAGVIIWFGIAMVIKLLI